MYLILLDLFVRAYMSWMFLDCLVLSWIVWDVLGFSVASFDALGFSWILLPYPLLIKPCWPLLALVFV